MQKVRVGLERRSYDIMIGHGLIINSGPIITPLLSQNRVVVITDQNVAPLHLRSYESSMNSAGVSVSSLVLPSGEGTKSWKYVIPVSYTHLRAHETGRNLVCRLLGLQPVSYTHLTLPTNREV